MTFAPPERGLCNHCALGTILAWHYSRRLTVTPNPSDIDRIKVAVSTSLHAHWLLFLVEGIVLLVLGLAAIVLPLIATVAVAIIIGWLLLMSGIVGLIATFRMRQAPGFGWSLLSAVLGIAVGVLLLWWPLSGALSLTVMLTVFFVIEGVASIFYSLEHKRELSARWGWMLVSGALDLILGGSIFLGLPGTAAWAIGLLVGINMVFGGSAIISMALLARTANRPATT
jgi:uncharacterized membrane protein HdeD (DUF308 family)